MLGLSRSCRGCGGWVTGRDARLRCSAGGLSGLGLAGSSGREFTSSVRLRGSLLLGRSRLLAQDPIRSAARLFASSAIAPCRHAFMRIPSAFALTSGIRGVFRWGQIVSFAKRRPFATNIGLCLGVGGLSDVVAQRTEGVRFDPRRVLMMCSFGLCMGILHWNLYMHVFPRLFPYAGTFSSLSLRQKMRDVAGQKELFKQVAIDLIVWMPFVYFPIFYSFKTLLSEGDSLEARDVPKAAMVTYHSTFFEDNVASLGIWIPGDMLMFGVPAWLRMPACYGVSFCWTTLLSFLRAGEGVAE